MKPPTGDTYVKIRHVLLLLVCLMLVVAGCGSDSDSKKPASKQDKANAADQADKKKAVDKAKSTFDKNKKDVNACRNLALAYIALASPAAPVDPQDQVTLPKDRDESLKKAISTLEKCVDIDSSNRDARQMLASTYMATNKYDKAAPLLEAIAKTAKGSERANAYYAWGLAASNAQDLQSAIAAWNQFVKLADKGDPRIPQVKQSIKALKAAASQPKAAATTDTTATDEKKSDEG